MKENKSAGDQIRVIHRSEEFDKFYFAQSDKVKEKFKYVMNVIAKVYDVPTKFIKHIQNTELFEMRVSVGTNEYRTIIFAIDHSNVIESKRIILLNAFLKKSNSDYRKQVKIALKLLDKILS